MPDIEMIALREFSRREEKSIARYFTGDIVMVPEDRVEAYEITGKAQRSTPAKKGK